MSSRTVMTPLINDFVSWWSRKTAQSTGYFCVVQKWQLFRLCRYVVKLIYHCYMFSSNALASMYFMWKLKLVLGAPGEHTERLVWNILQVFVTLPGMYFLHIMWQCWSTKQNAECFHYCVGTLCMIIDVVRVSVWAVCLHNVFWTMAWKCVVLFGRYWYI